MSIFKNHKTTADRSATDRSRHKKKIKEAIRKGIHNIVSDESIIGKDGKKKIVIPVRGIKEYRFVYGKNDKNKQVGSAPGKNVRRGQKIGNSKKQAQKAPGQEPGNEAGEEFYEVEITLEELSEYLFDSLNLPDLEKKKFTNIVGEKYKRSGYRKSGIRPRLSKKETLKRKIRRKKAKERLGILSEEERLPFHNDDLKYKYIKASPRENNNAVIFFIMDVSGSMTQNKKFIARSFFFLLYHFLRHKYEKTEIVFISHTSEAREVSEDEFFSRSNSGGTIISSGLEKCIEIAEKRFHRDSWNIYPFHCSDGDNWPSDNDKAIDLSRKLKEMSQLYCFIQINPGGPDSQFWSEGGMSEIYKPITDSKFKTVHISEPDHIWDEFRRIFGGSINE